MSHYDCRDCGQSYGVSAAHCPACTHQPPLEAWTSERYSDEDEALYTRWLAEDETLTISRAQHLRFQARIDRETKERAR